MGAGDLADRQELAGDLRDCVAPGQTVVWSSASATIKLWQIGLLWTTTLVLAVLGLALWLIPRDIDNDPFDGALRPAGQARAAARCSASGKARKGRAPYSAGCVAVRLRCAAPPREPRLAGRKREPGQMDHYQCPLVSGHLAPLTGPIARCG